MEVTPLKQVSVKTTAPITPIYIDSRPVIHTARLILRPLQDADLQALYTIRAQPEVMEWTASGKVDTLDQTRAVLNTMLDEGIQTKFQHAICLADTQEFIGYGGVRPSSYLLGWPEVGYQLRKEYWRQGYGTEFLTACLDEWWKLPRHEVTKFVDKFTIPDGETVEEKVCAVAIGHNKASCALLVKCGMQLTKLMELPDDRIEGQTVVLSGYCGSRNKQ